MKRLSNPTIVLYAAGLIFLLVAPAFLYPVLVMKILCFAMFACAFNLLLGYTGLLSFGHAAFFGTAVYLTAHALKVWAWPTLLGIAFGTAAAALLGLVIGFLAIRRQGIYFSMITLAMAQLVYFFFLQSPFTGGENGLHGIPRGDVLGIGLGGERSIYYFVVVVFALSFWLIHRTIQSPFGQVLRAIRENESRAVSLGYDVGRYKLLVFVLSAALAGLAGATKAVAFNLASLSDVHWHTSGDVVLMSLLGGMGTVLGPVVGSAVVVTLQTQFADKLGSLITVSMGGIFAVCVLAFRRGIVGEVGDWLSRQSMLSGTAKR